MQSKHEQFPYAGHSARLLKTRKNFALGEPQCLNPDSLKQMKRMLSAEIVDVWSLLNTWLLVEFKQFGSLDPHDYLWLFCTPQSTRALYLFTSLDAAGHIESESLRAL